MRKVVCRCVCGWKGVCVGEEGRVMLFSYMYRMANTDMIQLTFLSPLPLSFPDGF